MKYEYRESKYLQNRKPAPDAMDESFFTRLLAILVSVLYVYANWYVQTFNGISIVVKGSVICLSLFFLIHVFFIAKGNMRMEMVPTGVWVNLFLVAYCVIVGPFVAFDFNELVEALIIYAGYAVASLVICYISTLRKSIDWFLIITIITAILCGVYALFFGTKFLGYAIQLSPRNNIHILALVLVIGIFALAYRCKTTIKSLILHFIPAVFLLYCIVESTSRKCLIAAMIVIAIWLYSSLGRFWRTGSYTSRILIVAVLILICYGAYSYYNSYFLQSKTFARFEHFGDEESNTNRIEMYRIAFRIFTEKPIFGGGFHQFRFWSGRGGYSHSVYAESIADLGFVGTVMYFTPIITAGARLFRLAVSRNGTYASRITFAFYCAEIFLGVGQIYFLEPQHMFIFTILYWVEWHETQKLRAGETEGGNIGNVKCRYIQ